MLKGRAWCFGNDIDTDVIIPGKYLRSRDISSLARHVMEGIDSRFSSCIKKGDIIVAGRNFGCGSSREQAPLALKDAGVAVVVAKSFARIFYRNAINVGLPLVEADIACKEGEMVKIDLTAGIVSIGDKTMQGTKIPKFLMDILEDGGLVAHRKKEKQKLV